jgi:hypothetical protein
MVHFPKVYHAIRQSGVGTLVPFLSQSTTVEGFAPSYRYCHHAQQLELIAQ